MKPVTHYINFPLARQVQDCLDRLSTDQKIELAFAIGQRALDEKRSADVIRRDMDSLVNIHIQDDPKAIDAPDVQFYPGTFTWQSFDEQGIAPLVEIKE